MPLPARWQHEDLAAALLPPEVGAVGRTRRCVAALLGFPLADAVLGRAARGKPILVAPPGAAFSVAHRDGHSLVGAAWGGEVGVDLEMVRPDLDFCDIAGTFFAAAEAAWIRSLSDAQRSLGFTALWTVKEAVLKATGQGITQGLDTPMVDGSILSPLLAGADRIEASLMEGAAVQVRHGTVGGRQAVACLARVAQRPLDGTS